MIIFCIKLGSLQLQACGHNQSNMKLQEWFGNWRNWPMNFRIFISVDIDGLVQACRNSIANALELTLSCVKPLIYIITDTMINKVNTWHISSTQVIGNFIVLTHWLRANVAAIWHHYFLKQFSDLFLGTISYETVLGRMPEDLMNKSTLVHVMSVLVL